MSKIKIDAGVREAIPVELVGKDYTLMPPKAALAMRLAVEAKMLEDDPSKMLDTLNVWMDKAFGKKVANQIRKRIDTEDDDLDIVHIMTLMEAVVEFQTGNPTS